MELAHALSSLGHPRIVLVGDVMLDRYSFGEVQRISPEAPVPVLRVGKEEERLGGAGSVAADLLMLGARVDLLCVLGDDAAGIQVRRLAESAGARVHGCLVDSRRQTILKTRHIARSGPYGQQVLRVDREDAVPLAADVEERLLSAIRDALPGADALVLSDYAKGTLTRRVLKESIAAARAARIPVLVDPKGGDFTRYQGATCLTPNRREAAEATGISPIDEDSTRRAGRKLVELAELDVAIITLDRDGMALFHKDGRELMAPTRAREVFDVTGAGDMVMAMLALCGAGGLSWETAVHLANAAAGVEVSKLGSVPITRQEVLQALGEGTPAATKVLPVEELLPVLAARRAAGARVVFTNGCFDVLHVGHARYLAAARTEGDLLVVGVNDDASVSRLKGPDRPIVPLADRAELLAALACVDYVVSFSEDTPARLIGQVLPDVLVKGEDWKDKGVVGRDVVEARGGKVVLARLEPGRSTTDIVKRIRGS
ncbi:MAG: D-glycero-beta-D-manno-heptose 1-phosphate adenylyltransferase [Myxococcota bacterium]